MVPPFRFVEAPSRLPGQTLRTAVLEGLSQHPRSLPCRFFYDEIGSALFEQICELPEYYPTRTERAILEQHADDMIRAASASASGRPITLIELGSGSSVKTRLLIEAALRRQGALHYVPIDISGDFLRESAKTLQTDYPDLRITALAAEYSDALAVLPPREGPRLFLFLGSNIGNFCTKSAAALLSELRACMEPEDRLLIGVDLVKDIAALEAAYDDAAGVTARFNKNILARINRELDADFDLDLWEHRAPFNAEKSRIEMWLYSRCDQTVTIGGDADPAEFSFRAGEGIHTENSHKYTPTSFEALCRTADLAVEEIWTDPREWFASCLVAPRPSEAGE